MGPLLPNVKPQFLDDDGNPLVGGKLYTYLAGTTTPVITFTEYTLTSQNANPIVLDSRGECDLYLSNNTYKFVLKDSEDTTIWTQDNVEINDTGGLDVQTFATKTASYTLTRPTDNESIVYLDNTSNITVTLLDASAEDLGKPVTFIKNIDNQAKCTITATTDDIAGYSELVLAAKGESITLINDGTKWTILNYVPSEWIDYAFTDFIEGVTADPALGNGGAVIKYRMVAPWTMQIKADVTFGSTTTYGTGNWKFMIPLGLQVNTSQYFDDNLSNYMLHAAGLYVDSSTTNKQLYLFFSDQGLNNYFNMGDIAYNLIKSTWSPAMAANDDLVINLTLDLTPS